VIDDQVRDAVREDASLPRAGAGDDEQRPVRVADRLELGLVEAVEEALGGRDRDQPMLAAVHGEAEPGMRSGFSLTSA
jgi:hypothetical protein